jgi:hypothetical protein
MNGSGTMETWSCEWMDVITGFERGKSAKLIETEADAEWNDKCSQELKQQQAAVKNMIRLACDRPRICAENMQEELLT